MRILAVHPGPSFSVSDVHRGWVRALTRLGCQVINFDFDQRLALYGSAHVKDEFTGELIKAFDDQGAVHLAAKGIEVAAFEFWPDVVLVTSGFFIPPAMYEVFRARGMKTVLLHTEEPYELDRNLKRATLVDMNLLNDPTNLEAFRAVHPNTHYIPHAYDPDLHKPGEPLDGLASDFCFVGTGYKSRIEFLEEVDWNGIDVALAGNWQALDADSHLNKYVSHDIRACCSNDEAVDLYRATKVSANLYRREAQRPELSAGWAMGPREVELAATGTFFLREQRGESDEVLPMLPVFDGPGDFEEKLRFYLGHEDLRETYAEQARAAVRDRTFDTNAKRLLKLLA